MKNFLKTNDLEKNTKKFAKISLLKTRKLINKKKSFDDNSSGNLSILFLFIF